MYDNDKMPSRVYPIRHTTSVPSVHHSYDYIFRGDYPDWCLKIDAEGFKQKKHQEFNLKQAIKKSNDLQK